MWQQNRALHALLIALAAWLPLGQALALCCVTPPEQQALATTVSNDLDLAVNDQAPPCPGHAAMAVSAAADGPASTLPATGDAEASCSDGDCNHACHAGAVVRDGVQAPAAVLSTESDAALQVASHAPHQRRLLRPPISSR